MTERTSVGTVADLHESATKITGLTDFGEPDYLDGLQVLLDSYDREAALTPLGIKYSRSFLRGALVARALSEAAFARHPEHESIPVERPIFVTGLPRTGTTALHRLLAADPANQGLEMWLTEFPQPRPPRATWESDPVYRRIQSGFDQHHAANPEFMGVHYMSADDVEECWQLLRQSCMSVSYETLAHIPTYSTWLAGQDWTHAYVRHRKNLQLIGLPDRDKRWVLKNPSHLFALDALMATYPDALIVQTHRPPSTAMPSACSLSAQATDGWSTVFRGDVIGQDQVALWGRGLDAFADARRRYAPEQFVDVDFADFVAHPLDTVASIYRAFGIALTDEASAAMADVQRESRTGDRKPAHRYTLADFGLSEATVGERFAHQPAG